MIRKSVRRFPRDKRVAFARRSCANKKLKRDDDSSSTHRALDGDVRQHKSSAQPTDWTRGVARVSAARAGTEAVTVSVSNLFQVNDDPRRFGLMRRQLREVRIAPISKAYHLSMLSFHSRDLEQLQHVESSGVEEKGMRPKQFAELRDRRMILGKDLCSKLSQGLAYLGFVQLHDLLLILWHPNAVLL